ncbi:BnaC02g29730D [Brassica napus]|uniref:BnaC02g29730D protein n=2 Tax=Brassica napus TaxID=3708 RepID=A0A078FIF2_BRANA|nr:BnaC02g29730D [Brassica napus]
MIRFCENTCLHLVYEMWDSMIENIIMAHWAKNNTPLQYLAHSLNPRLYMMFTMDPKKWWANVGAQTPFLQTLAFKLLGQPSASSCA